MIYLNLFFALFVSKVHAVPETPVLVAWTSLAKPNEPMIEQFLKKHASQVHERDRAYIGDGRTALHQAAATGNLRLVQLFMQYGANVDALNSNHETPLHFAARFGHVSVMKFLISKRAKLNEKSKYNQATPLMEAADMGHKEAIKILVRAGADQNLKDTFGKTAPERYKEYVSNSYTRPTRRN